MVVQLIGLDLAIPIPAARALATSSYGGIIASRAVQLGPPTFCHQSKNLSLKKLPARKTLLLGSPADVKVRQFGTVSFSKNGVGSIFTIKNQLAPHPQIPGDRRKLATPHEWPHPSAVSCNQP